MRCKQTVWICSDECCEEVRLEFHCSLRNKASFDDDDLKTKTKNKENVETKEIFSIEATASVSETNLHLIDRSPPPPPPQNNQQLETQTIFTKIVYIQQ